MYISYLKTKIIGCLQYKTAAIAGLLTQIFWGLMYCLIYQAFYKNNNINVNFNQLITYVWLNQAFISLIYVGVKDTEITNSISDGTIAYELLRPYNLYFWWYIKILSGKLSGCMLRCLPIILFAFILPYPFKLNLPISLISFVLFIISLILGTLLLCGIIMIIHTISFFTINADGINGIISNIISALSGFVLPVFLFPNILQKITYYLPFRLIGDLPFRIYSGNIGTIEALTTILLQLIWIIIIIIIGYMILKKALKKVSVQGG